MTKIHVYIWKRPDGEPFYVGLTSSTNRSDPVRCTSKHNWLCDGLVKEIGPENVLVERIHLESVEAAKALEVELITKHGRLNIGTGKLTNLRAGGEGYNGFTEEGRAKLSKRLKENNPMADPAIRAKASASLRASGMMAGDNNPSKREDVRAKLKAKWQDPEFREKQRLARTGKKRSEEFKERARRALLDPNHPIHAAAIASNSDPKAIEARKAGRKKKKLIS